MGKEGKRKISLSNSHVVAHTYTWIMCEANTVLNDVWVQLLHPSEKVENSCGKCVFISGIKFCNCRVITLFPTNRWLFVLFSVQKQVCHALFCMFNSVFFCLHRYVIDWFFNIFFVCINLFVYCCVCGFAHFAVGFLLIEY